MALRAIAGTENRPSRLLEPKARGSLPLTGRAQVRCFSGVKGFPDRFTDLKASQRLWHATLLSVLLPAFRPTVVRDA